MDLDYTPDFFKAAEAYIKENHGYANPTFSYTVQEPGDERCPMILVRDNDTAAGEDLGMEENQDITAEQDGKNITLSVGDNYKDVAALHGLVIIMHIRTYGDTQFNIITQGQLDGLIEPEKFFDAQMGTMNWLHIVDIYKTVPPINGYVVTFVPKGTEGAPLEWRACS